MKIDLSDENVAKTIMYDDLLAQDLKTNKKRIGVLISNCDCTEIKLDRRLYTLKEFKKAYKNRRVLSTHEYKEYLSVMIERVVN